jgi:hypothetical protein
MRNSRSKEEYHIQPGDTKSKIAERISKDLGITIPASSIANKTPLKEEKKLFSNDKVLGSVPITILGQY